MVVAGVEGFANASPDQAPGASAPSPSAGVPSARTYAATLRAAQDDAGAEARALGLGAKEKLVVRDVIKAADGTVHTRYERTYGGLPVLGGDLVVHEGKGTARSATKATGARISVPSLDAAKSAASAEKTALTASGEEDTTGRRAASPRKVIWAADGKPALAWETVVTGTQPDGTPSELHVVTDAVTGKRLHTSEAIETGTGTGNYNGTVPLNTSKSGRSYTLTDSARGGHKTNDAGNSASETDPGELFTDKDDKWGGGRQTAAVDAAYGHGKTWDFYKSVLKRNGIRNDGKAAFSRVHVGNNYANAYWNDDCFCMSYGDGEDGNHPITELDVAAHELSHGVTSATAGLEYRGESGGLNEATSDIFGTAVEFFAKNPKDRADYLIGELVDLRGDGKPLRYMDQPSKDGQSQDYWDQRTGGLNPHLSSGVGNHFFYLLGEGSGAKTINGVRYNSPTKDGSKVTGIGRDKAIRIWYKALTEQFTSTTDYAAARQGTVKAASELFGNGSKEVKAVEAAWTAVNVK
ncbi:M4 family metallopeptidase [Streptomyces sp. NPDC127074]|uniref:M4 family metallopeptidase n=1 Tax=Streptomyces sp. NPDC127074 TaxID=3347130 RepID=UPI0036547C4B